MTVTRIAEQVNDGSLPAHAPAREALRLIGEREPDVRAWRHVMSAAVAGEAPIHVHGPLAGVPIGIKDILDVAGMPTGYGVEAFETGEARFDACVVGVLRAAGALPIGKTVTAEFASRTPGATRNPNAPGHTPGGSSSGSAAAVAAGMVPAAIGTQTGGSMIRPAAYCGVVGFKPSFGRVFRDGMKLTCESLDTIGWYTGNVSDARRLARVLLDEDDLPRDMDRAPLTVAIQSRNPEVDADSRTLAEIARARGLLEAHGVRCVDAYPAAACAALMQAHAVIMHYEFARSLAPVVDRYAARLSDALLETVEKGSGISGGRYREMRELQASMRAGWRALYGEADLVLAPSTPGAAPAGLESTGSSSFNRVWSLLGWPCLHLPTSAPGAGLPIGIQLIGDFHADIMLLAQGQRLHRLLTQQGE
uniref:amidase n=1 Tax=Bordetella sputigena TaxID=1416810 RepID=UPI0039EEBE61